MVVIVTADIVLRNLTRSGFVWANEVSEYALYLITLLTAPWLLRRGQHVRLDLVLTLVPARVAWLMEAIGDVLGFVVCVGADALRLAMTLRQLRGSARSPSRIWCSRNGGCWRRCRSTFVLLAIEFVFRFDRLMRGDAVAPRRGDLGRAERMSWVEASILLFGGLVAVMALGLPVAFAFLAINIVGACSSSAASPA